MTILMDAGATDRCKTVDHVWQMLPKGTGTGPRVLDVFCNSHGDRDHCAGYSRMKALGQDKKLVVGSIWHPNYDRTKVAEKSDLPECYLDLRTEILRRRKVASEGRKAGDYECSLTAWQDHTSIPHYNAFPTDVAVRVLSPYQKDKDEEDWDVNDLSLVVQLEISGLTLLFTGDVSSAYWLDRIKKHITDQPSYAPWATSTILVTSHHGSYTFFGSNRDDVREADPHPDNYPALTAISPWFLVVSAKEKFPVSGDSDGDLPPHYAAWKWYHMWFQANRKVKADDNHPLEFKYTVDGHLRLEYDETKQQWEWIPDWVPPQGGGSDEDGEAKRMWFSESGKSTDRSGGQYA